MPKSKRARPAILSKTGKKGRDNKVKLMSAIRDAVAAYSTCYVLQLTNVNNELLARIRTALGGSRLFCGKQAVMAAALGTTESTEIATHIHLIAKALKGQRALLCSDVEYDDLEQFCDTLSRQEQYARAGQTATTTIELPSGPLPTEQFAHPMEPLLRKLGLPTKLNAGIIELTRDVVVCNEGDVLTPEQCKILRLFDEKLATFNIAVVARWRDPHGAEFYLDSDGEEVIDGPVQPRATKRKAQQKAKAKSPAKPPANKKVKTSNRQEEDDEADEDVMEEEDEDEVVEVEEEEDAGDDDEEQYDGVPRPMEEHEFDDNGPWGEIPVPVIEKTQTKQKKRNRH